MAPDAAGRWIPPACRSDGARDSNGRASDSASRDGLEQFGLAGTLAPRPLSKAGLEDSFRDVTPEPVCAPGRSLFPTGASPGAWSIEMASCCRQVPACSFRWSIGFTGWKDRKDQEAGTGWTGGLERLVPACAPTACASELRAGSRCPAKDYRGEPAICRGPPAGYTSPKPQGKRGSPALVLAAVPWTCSLLRGQARGSLPVGL
jgi:hypothetical protein